jgi:GntR family transcriptional regulator
VDQTAHSKQELARDALLELVGGLEIGAAIPPERRLADPARRLAARRWHAIDELVREGLLLRRHGSGTYVAGAEDALPLTMTSFSGGHAPARACARQPRASFEEQSAGRQARRAPAASPADRCGSSAALRLPTRETMAIEVLTSQRIAPELTREDLEGTRSTSCCASARQSWSLGRQTIEPTVTSEEEAEILGVPAARPGLPLRADHDERARGGGGVRPVRLSRGSVPARDGAAACAAIARKGAGRQRRPARCRRVGDGLQIIIHAPRAAGLRGG